MGVIDNRPQDLMFPAVQYEETKQTKTTTTYKDTTYQVELSGSS